MAGRSRCRARSGRARHSWFGSPCRGKAHATTDSSNIWRPDRMGPDGKAGALMRWRIIPREESFYELFEKDAANLSETARLLQKLIVDFHDPEARHAEIRQREHEGDEVTHQIIRALNTTFVTPFDREDIHRPASGIDDI